MINAAQRSAAFVVALVAVFAVALWVGNTVRPTNDAAEQHADAPATPAAPELPGGLQFTQYTVTLSGTPTVGESSKLTLTVRRFDKPVTDLQPHLGAYGHLVALRASDLAYLHVHPAGEPGDGATPAGPEIGFHTAFPSAADYRLYLDFQHHGVVRTAEFTDAQNATPPAQPADPGHGH